MSAPQGINLQLNASWQTSKMFVDLAHTFEAWKPVAPATTLALSPDGDPLALASTRTMAVDYPTGTYKLSYSGTGTITFTGQHAPTLGPIAQGADGISRADLSLTEGPGYLTLTIASTDPTDPVRDIRLIHPAYDPTAPPTWTTDFLERLRPFSVLRCMDIQRTNNQAAGPVEWASRPKLTDAIWTTPSGVPLEALIELANVLHKDIWVNVPDQASDDYVEQMASLFMSYLDSGLNIYLEYGNELWNSGFAQYTRNAATALANTALTAKDAFGRAGQQAALRAVQVGRLARSEFGSYGEDRLRVVLGGQPATWFASSGLAYLKSIGINPGAEFYGLAIAPYATLPVASDEPGLTTDAIFAALNADLKTRLIPRIADNAALAKQYGLALVAYEWGQNTEGKAGANLPVKLAAQNDPRMGDLYRSIASAWSSAGGGLMCHFGSPASQWDEWGAWGCFPHCDFASSVKWDALTGLICPGDLNGDGVVNYDDFLRLMDAGAAPADVAAWLATGPVLTDPQRAKVAAAMAPKH